MLPLRTAPRTRCSKVAGSPIAAPDHDQDEADRHSRRGAREIAQIPQHDEERKHAERGHGYTVVRARQDHRQEQEQEQRNEVARGHPPGEPEVQHERAGQGDHLGMAVGAFGKRSQSAVARDEPEVSRVSGIVQDDACQIRHEDAQSEHLDQFDRRFPVAAHDRHRQQNERECVLGAYDDRAHRRAVDQAAADQRSHQERKSCNQ
jgi:hypothetical protein